MITGLLILIILSTPFIMYRFIIRRLSISKIEKCRRLYPYWFKKHVGEVGDISSLSYKRIEEIYSRVAPSMSHEGILVKENEQIRKQENEDYIERLKQQQLMDKATAFQSWYDRQIAFYKKCVAHAPKSFGRKKQLIEVKGIDKYGKEITQPFPVCHLFAHSIPPREYINNYDNDSAEKEYPNSYPLFYKPFHHSFIEALSLMDNIDGEQKSLPENDYTNILSITSTLASEDTVVLLIDTPYGNKEEFRDRVYSVIKKQLVDKRIQCFNIEDVQDYPLQYIRKKNIIVIEFLSFADEVKSNCHSLFNNNVHTYTEQLQNANVSLAYLSVYNELPISYVAERMDTQTQKDKELYDKLLKEGTLLSPSPFWVKTGIVRLFLTQKTESHCLILTSSTWHVRTWNDTLFDIGLNKETYIVAPYSQYDEYDDTNYDLLVFDNADKLELGKRAEICGIIDADYVLTLDSVSNEDEVLLKTAQKPKRLKACVSSWGFVPQSGLHHSFFIRYYPTSLQDFEATDAEWQDRWFIWNFKNNPDKQKEDSPYYHKQALDDAIDMLKERLNQTFGELLPELTLVCVPASSSSKNEARYKEFSELLCERTGMSNAYTHFSVTEEAYGENEWNSIDAVFDWDYFRGRSILLFDVLLSTGESLRNYSELMDSHGAEVIACITLGKSFHQREEEEVFSFE